MRHTYRKCYIMQNPPKQVPHVKNDPDSDPSSSDSSSSDSSDSSDSGYYKRALRTRKKIQVKRNNTEPIKKCDNPTSKLLKAAYNYKVTKFKLDEDPLQCQVYFLTLMNSLITVYHNLSRLALCLWNILP